MNETACQKLAEFVGVLANPYRIRILCVLALGEENVGGIAAAVSLSPPHVSAHLRVLYDRGYVSRRREWKQVYYSLKDPGIGAFIDMAAQLANQEAAKGLGASRLAS